MVKCSICDKKMPERVLQAHISKRHSEHAREKLVEEVAGITDLNLGEVPKTATEVEVNKKTCDCPCQKTITCGTCSREVSELVIPYHLHVIHGL